MEWFPDGVVDAIAVCRRDKSLFIVYVYDDSIASTKTTEAWNSDKVCGVLSPNQYVAIQVAKDSVEHQQFSQLYPVFVFPSAFCIGLTGQTLVIMNGQQSSLQIKDKLTEAFEKLHDEVQSPSAVQPQAMPTQPETPPTQTQDTPTEQPSDSTSTQPLASSPSPEEIESPPITSEIHSPPSEGAKEEESVRGAQRQQEESREEKLERAQQKIRQRRQEREEAEFKNQKSAELQRRDGGKQMVGAQRNHEELRKKTWLQERKKAKEEEKKAREAIRAKLRQDQMEREAQKKAREQATSELRQQSIPSQASPSTTPSISTNEYGACRLQLRLPHGGKSVLEMRAKDSLAALRERVAEEICESAGSLVLSSTYPRRELTADLDNQSLAQLSLAPSGVVIVRLTGGLSMSSGTSGSSGFLWSLIMSVFQLLMSFVALLKRICGVGSDASNEQEPAPTRSYPGRSGGSDKRVHRFRPGDYEDETTDDDEERRNTYNGNSTEQQ